MSGESLNPRADAVDGGTLGVTEVCPHFHAAIELIGKRWSGAIVWTLGDQQLRFGDLRRAVPGLSDRLLSQRLRELEDAGLVERQVEGGKPVRVLYGLTEKGRGLLPAVHAVEQWANDWKAPVHPV